jgi:hypothetical protein
MDNDQREGGVSFCCNAFKVSDLIFVFSLSVELSGHNLHMELKLAEAVCIASDL